MKYNDNGTYKDIYVKAFDTLPVGAIVEYSGSTIPSGWTDIGNNQIRKTSQYIEGGASLSNVYGTSDENGYTQEYINGLETYSTTETICGTWLGKPLYQKVIYINSLPNNSTVYYGIFSSSEINNIDICFIDEGNSYMTVTDAGHTEADTMNWIYSTSGYVMTCIYDKQIRIITKDNKSTTSAYVTVKYTKTTD